MNRLASETSPYLRQHAENPVDWFAWSDEAFARARELDWPVMLSIGYSSCHWCHVMAHESFEDSETAAALNRSFVSVKVDREERPDVDAIYMDAVQAVSGHGGWPMTVFLTPDARPFFAGTYFPARDMGAMPSFRRVLEAVDDAWHNRRAEVEQQADALTEALSTSSRLPDSAWGLSGGAGTVAAQASAAISAGASALAVRFDPAWGGFGPAPKFPHPVLVDLCLVHHRLSGEESSLAMGTRTLKAMAAGGIYDHLGGGFHRYSTDHTWTVPHFEKMLYDQAGLVRAYLHAWKATGDRQWLAVVQESVGYVLRDLGLAAGGFSSAEDADSEGEEGRFYVWSPDQITAVLGRQPASAVMEWYGVTEGGNFEGRSILRRPLASSLLRPPEVEQARQALLDTRSRRVRPGRDDKVLTEWNAMFGAALAEAAGATGRRDWREAAELLGEFLFVELRRKGDGRWLRSWQEGRAQHLAYAADHAWVVDFFTRLAELTGHAVWLDRAEETAAAMVDLFADGTSPLFTTGSDAERLVVRPIELSDGATPSASSVAAAALIRLGTLTGDDKLRSTGESLVRTMLELGADQPLAVASAVCAGPMAGAGITEVVVGGVRPDLVSSVHSRYEPNLVLAWGEHTDSPLWQGREDPVAYVCRHYTCLVPAATVEDLTERLEAELDADRSRFTQAAGT